MLTLQGSCSWLFLPLFLLIVSAFSATRGEDHHSFPDPPLSPCFTSCISHILCFNIIFKMLLILAWSQGIFWHCCVRACSWRQRLLFHCRVKLFLIWWLLSWAARLCSRLSSCNQRPQGSGSVVTHSLSGLNRVPYTGGNVITTRGGVHIYVQWDCFPHFSRALWLFELPWNKHNTLRIQLSVNDCPHLGLMSGSFVITACTARDTQPRLWFLLILVLLWLLLVKVKTYW